MCITDSPVGDDGGVRFPRNCRLVLWKRTDLALTKVYPLLTKVMEIAYAFVFLDN